MFCIKSRPKACFFYIEPSWSMIVTQKNGQFSIKKTVAEPVEATIFNFQPIKLMVYDT